jgi:hypothetical protein
MVRHPIKKMTPQGNYCVMTNTNELQVSCPRSRALPDASRTAGYLALGPVPDHQVQPGQG